MRSHILIAVFTVVLAASAPAQVFTTVGVYDPNHAVNFTAAGSTLNLIQFKSDVASAFTNNLGGVNQCYAVGASAGPYTFSFGINHVNTLSMTGDTNTSIGITASNAFVRSTSESGIWVSFNPSATFNLHLTSNVPATAVVQFGLTVLSPSYFTMSNVTATATFSGGGQATASRVINEGAGLGNTFFGFAAPVGETITSVTFTNSQGHEMFFDDIGFITAATNVVPPILKIVLSDTTHVQVSWPSYASSYALEYTTNLDNPVWLTDTNPLSLPGVFKTIPIDSATGHRFYRLHGP